MNILFDHQIFMMQRYGGISRYYLQTAIELNKLGQNAHIVAPFYINKYLPDAPNGLVFGRAIEDFPFRWQSMTQAVGRFSVNRHAKRFKPDIVHETYFSTEPSVKSAVPTVLTMYDMMPEIADRDNKKKNKHCLWKEAAVARADHIICISQHTKTDLMNMLGVSASKLSVVYLAQEFVEPNPVVSADLKSQKPYILYVGQRYGWKNFSRLLAVFGNSKRLRETFDLVAFGPQTKVQPDEIEMIAKLGLGEDQVRFLTGGDDVLAALYSNAAAFVYPSLYEGFGLPPLEAMAHGCPVISTNTSSLPEVVGNAGEYFDPLSQDEMRHALEAVVFSPTRTAELIALGRAQAAKFSWEKCAKETLDVYRKVSGKQ